VTMGDRLLSSIRPLSISSLLSFTLLLGGESKEAVPAVRDRWARGGRLPARRPKARDPPAPRGPSGSSSRKIRQDLSVALADHLAIGGSDRRRAARERARLLKGRRGPLPTRARFGDGASSGGGAVPARRRGARATCGRAGPDGGAARSVGLGLKLQDAGRDRFEELLRSPNL